MPVRLWRAYQRALHAYPVRTASISAGCLMSTGDILSQFLVQKRSLAEYDGKRTLRFAFFGTFLGGPVITVWYSTLARVFGNTKFGPLKMVLCDQLLFAPIFLPYFLSGMEILKGEGLEAIKSKLKHVYLDVLKTNYKVWPFVQTVNFSFVPAAYRVVVVNLVAVGWNTYLAWMSEKTHHHTEPADQGDLDLAHDQHEKSS